MDTNTRSPQNPGPREVALDTEWGRLTYLEQVARIPMTGHSQMVRWRGALDGVPIDRERLANLVLSHAILTLDLAS